MTLRVALITYNWPPRNAIGTHRPYGWAKYWSRIGAHVTVITAGKKEFDQPLDSELPILPGVKVIEVAYRSVIPSGNAGRSLRYQRFIGLLKHLNRLVRAKLGLVLDPRDRWAKDAESVAVSIAHQVDVVVSTFGPRSSHLIASRMKRQVPSLLWVADYRDLWSNNHMGGYGQLAKATQRSRERRTVGSRADFLTTVSDELAGELRSLLGKPVYVVPNGFDADELVIEQQSPADKRRLVYTGMLYQGTRDPSPLFSALKKMRERNELSCEHLSVEFFGPYEPWLEKLIESYDLGEIVKLRGRVGRPEALSAQRSSDALILLESGDASANGVLTGKLFEYLLAGRPILSLGSRPGSAIGRLLEECGVGVCAGSDEDIICQEIRTLLSNSTFSWYRPRAESIAAYSRERQAGFMLDLMRDKLGNSSVIDSKVH